jgi:hypothetical protein
MPQSVINIGWYQRMLKSLGIILQAYEVVMIAYQVSSSKIIEIIVIFTFDANDS